VPEWRQAKRDWAAESQDEPIYVPGERVRHAIFGTGTIAEIGGQGRDVKATIAFDDDAVGKKTIKLAYTKLERE
jgi:DNA helicase-2/ATP-dependent DNA helicase PcrA